MMLCICLPIFHETNHFFAAAASGYCRSASSASCRLKAPENCPFWPQLWPHCLCRPFHFPGKTKFSMKKPTDNGAKFSVHSNHYFWFNCALLTHSTQWAQFKTKKHTYTWASFSRLALQPVQRRFESPFLFTFLWLGGATCLGRYLLCLLNKPAWTLNWKKIIRINLLRTAHPMSSKSPESQWCQTDFKRF